MIVIDMVNPMLLNASLRITEMKKTEFGLFKSLRLFVLLQSYQC